jgi:O-antigen/teichoic acid export membrane protein
MSSFRLILKNLTAIFTANVISILIELVQPVVFFHSYNKAIYADWLVLSSAVSYLSNLNFGLQTFVNQDLAVRYNRGEQEGFHVQQSTALRALVATTLFASFCCLIIFVLPVEHIFGLTISTDSKVLLPHWIAATTLYFISLQILVGSLLFGYFGGAFMGVGLAHRGSNWNNAKRFATAALLVVLALMHQPLHVLAIGQFLLFMVLMVGIVIDLKLKAPDIFPTLRYWDFDALKSMMAPSLHFMLLYFSNYIAFELPLILIQRIAGPIATLIFQFGRKLFSFGRQVLTGLTQSIGPEITRIYGQNDWVRLSKLYDYSERVIFFLIAMFNVPLFAFSPILLHLWLHKPELFALDTYLLLALTATVLCVKEHKMQFQFSTNTHIEFARVNFLTYVGMTIVSIATIKFYGLNGFIATWLITEVVQTVSVVSLNRQLFAEHEGLSMAYLAKLAGLCTAGLAVGYVLLRSMERANWGFPRQIVADAVLAFVLAALSWYAFNMNSLTGFMKEKLRSRFRPVSAA